MRCVAAATHSYGTSVVPLGDSALVKIPYADGGDDDDGGILVILNTNRTQTFNPDAFTNLGCDFASQRILIVKSTNHFYPAFAAIASEVLYVDTGLTFGSPYPSNPSLTKFTKITREIWPRVADPHGIGSEHVPWVRAAAPAPVAEEELALAEAVETLSRL